MLRDHGVERGDRVAMLLPPTPETAAMFFGTWKPGAILLSMSVLYGDEGIRHRLTDSQAKVLVTDAATQTGRRDLVEHVIVLDQPAARRCLRERRRTWTRPRTTPPSSITRPAPPGSRRASSTPTATSSPTRSSPTAMTCARTSCSTEWGRAWAAGSLRCSARRLGAAQFVFQREGGFDPEQQLAVLSKHRPTNVFTTPTAMRALMGVTDAGARYPQDFRVVCSAGEPLNPEAIRWFRDQYGLTVLDFYGLTESYPLVANYPFMEVREGSMGRPMPGWDVQILDEDEHPLRPGSGARSACARAQPALSARLLEPPRGIRGDFRRRLVPHQGRGRAGRDGDYWYAGRADDVIISAGYRIGPFEVESACIEHPAVREAAAVASPDERRGNVVKAFVVLAEGHAPSDELADEIKRFVRDRHSAYAYPRRIEFVGPAEDAHGQDQARRAARARAHRG